MTIAKVLFIVVVFAFITFGGVLAVLSMSRPAIGGFVRRHLRKLYLLQALGWGAMAILFVLTESRIRTFGTVLSVANALLFSSMCFLKCRDSGRVDGN